jgi:hypothetical protein
MMLIKEDGKGIWKVKHGNVAGYGATQPTTTHARRLRGSLGKSASVTDKGLSKMTRFLGGRRTPSFSEPSRSIFESRWRKKTAYWKAAPKT